MRGFSPIHKVLLGDFHDRIRNYNKPAALPEGEPSCSFGGPLGPTGFFFPIPSDLITPPMVF